MASAPQVRDLNQLIGELGQAYIPQKTQIDQDIQAAENSGQAQEAGLGGIFWIVPPSRDNPTLSPAIT